VKPPVVGPALGHTWVVMLTVGVASGSPLTMMLVGVGVYPFMHLAVQVWNFWRGSRHDG
jgi:hypothetical protein